MRDWSIWLLGSLTYGVEDDVARVSCSCGLGSEFVRHLMSVWLCPCHCRQAVRVGAGRWPVENINGSIVETADATTSGRQIGRAHVYLWVYC
jgi:hypothetical protein